MKRIQYAAGELTYVERQLRDFFAKPARLTRKGSTKFVKADWAPKEDLLNGKGAGRRETRQEQAEARGTYF